MRRFGKRDQLVVRPYGGIGAFADTREGRARSHPMSAATGSQEPRDGGQ